MSKFYSWLYIFYVLFFLFKIRDLLFLDLFFSSSFFCFSNSVFSSVYLTIKNVDIAWRVKLNLAHGDNITSKMLLKISSIPPILLKKSRILKTSLFVWISNTSVDYLNSKRIVELSNLGISFSRTCPIDVKIFSFELPKILK